MNGNGFKIDIISVCFYDQCTYLALRIRLPWFVRVGSGPGPVKKLTNPDPNSDIKSFTIPNGQKLIVVWMLMYNLFPYLWQGFVIRIYFFRFVIQTKTGHNMDSFVSSVSAYGLLFIFNVHFLEAKL